MKKYKTIQSWQNAMRKEKDRGNLLDWYNIAGDWYVQEEYDESGKYMRYTSITAWQHIDVETSNRYGDSFLSDMEATAYPVEDLRFALSYYIGDTELTKDQTRELYNKLVLNNKSFAMKQLTYILIDNLK